MRKYFRGNYLIPLPIWNEDQKKGLRQKIEVFFPEIRRRPKKRKDKSLHHNLGTTFGRDLKGLFVLVGSCSSDDPALKSRWGDAKSRWGTAKSRWGDANSRWGDAFPLQFKY